MRDFFFYNPTKIIFGKSSFEKIRQQILPNTNLLVVYGQGSVKRAGIYEKVINNLDKTIKIFEFGGIKPNPDFETCYKAKSIIEKGNIDYILAIGGGSVIDATKFISILPNFSNKDEAKRFLKSNIFTVEKKIPFGCVLTAPGTGSEMNNGFVITDNDTKQKLVKITDKTFPEFSILNPEVMDTLPKQQIINGFVDTFIHILEQYITHKHDFILQDRLSEAMLKTLIEVSPKLFSKEIDYSSKANFMWTASLALNNLLSRGVPSDWTTHYISHIITSEFGIPHAQALAITLFGVWTFKFDDKKEKLSIYGRNVWNLSGIDEEIAKKAILKTASFFKSIGMPIDPKYYGLSKDGVLNALDKYLDENLKLGERGDISADNVKEIVNLSFDFVEELL